MRLLSTEVRGTSVASAIGAALLVGGVALVAASGSAVAAPVNGDIVACATFSTPDTVDNGGGVFKVLTNNINDNTKRNLNDFIRFDVIKAGYTIVSSDVTNDDGTKGVFSTGSGAQPGQSVAYNSPNDSRGTYIVSAKVCASKPAPPTTNTVPPTTTMVPPVSTTPGCDNPKYFVGYGVTGAPSDLANPGLSKITYSASPAGTTKNVTITVKPGVVLCTTLFYDINPAETGPFPVSARSNNPVIASHTSAKAGQAVEVSATDVVATTTTVPPTSTTVAPATTTAAIPTTVAALPATSVVAVPTVAVPTATVAAVRTGIVSQADRGGLASTGVNALPLVVGGLVLIGTGTAAILSSRRRGR